jgi:hypothetical protein
MSSDLYVAVWGLHLFNNEVQFRITLYCALTSENPFDWPSAAPSKQKSYPPLEEYMNLSYRCPTLFAGLVGPSADGSDPT